jgi:hypothetical protein
MKNWMISGLFAILLIPFWGLAQVTFSPEQPQVGEEVQLGFETPQSYLKITYRPNSSIVETDSIPLDMAASFTWTPDKAGVYNFSSDSFSTNVSVRFQGVSWTGIVTMVLAGLILFGGAAFAFRNLFKKSAETKEEIDLDVEHRPDT